MTTRGRAGRRPARGPGRPRRGSRAPSREALLEAGALVVAEHGAAGLTLREVARRASVEPPLVTYYFGGREGFLAALTDHLLGRLGARLLKLPSGGPPTQALRGLVHALVSGLGEGPQIVALLADSFAGDDAERLDYVRTRLEEPGCDVLARVLGVSGRPETACFAWNVVAGAANRLAMAAPANQRALGTEWSPAVLARYADYTAEVLARGLGLEEEAR